MSRRFHSLRSYFVKDVRIPASLSYFETFNQLYILGLGFCKFADGGKSDEGVDLRGVI